MKDFHFDAISAFENYEIDKMRMFFMGNALVTEIVKKIGDFIKKID